MEGKTHIGTSGWSYAGWLGNFYPPKIKSKEILPYYSKIFQSVELNNSFYQIPKEKNVKTWRELTPNNFIFSCKASRYITHMKKLNDVKEGLNRLLHAFSFFEEKLGPILFQFPPYWPLNLSILEQFIVQLPKQYQYTFEFRHQSWFCQALYDLLHQHQMSLCFYDYKTYQSPEIVTGKFIYIRMHGPNKEAYQGSYNDNKLETCANKIRNWQQKGLNVFCYFDNDAKSCAPFDAERLKKILPD